MKKLRIFLTTFLMIFALAFAGCQGRSSEPTIDNKEVFEEDLQPLEGEELENMENPDISDEEMFALEEEELDKLGEISQEEESDDQGGAIVVKEDGTYTSKDEVATYIYQFKKLPSNYITKSEAQKLGWDSSRGNLDEGGSGKEHRRRCFQEL